jgi:hypothetical protein
VAQLDAIAVEHPRGLLDVRQRVGVDLLAGELRASRGAAAGIAHAGGVVADDQHDDVPAVLELAQLAQDDRMAEVDVGRRRVQPELDAQRAAERELARESPVGEAVDRVTGQPAGIVGRVGRHNSNARVSPCPGRAAACCPKGITGVATAPSGASAFA